MYHFKNGLSMLEEVPARKKRAGQGFDRLSPNGIDTLVTCPLAKL
jgi:hypothetical protein